MHSSGATLVRKARRGCCCFSCYHILILGRASGSCSRSFGPYKTTQQLGIYVPGTHLPLPTAAQYVDKLAHLKNDQLLAFYLNGEWRPAKWWMTYWDLSVSVLLALLEQ